MMKFILYSRAARRLSSVKRFRRDLVRYGVLYLYDGFVFSFTLTNSDL